MPESHAPQLANDLLDAVSKKPPDWRRATDKWFDLSVECKDTKLEGVVNSIGRGILLRDVSQVHDLAESVARTIDQDPEADSRQ